MRAGLYATCLVLAGVMPASAQEHSNGTLALDVMDPRPEVTQAIDDRLLLRVHSQGDHDWEVQVVERPLREFPENLLYHSSEWHGPYPTQVFAWNVAERRFPEERWLCVRNHPYEVAVRLANMATDGAGPDARFVHGTIEVAWFHRQCKRGFGY